MGAAPDAATVEFVESWPEAAFRLERSLLQVRRSLEVARRDLTRAETCYRALERSGRVSTEAPTRFRFATKGLSRQEVRVLLLLLEGQSNQEIGEHLQLSINTVKSHVRGVLRKLHAHSRWQLAELTEQRTAPEILAPPSLAG